MGWPVGCPTWGASVGQPTGQPVYRYSGGCIGPCCVLPVFLVGGFVGCGFLAAVPGCGFWICGGYGLVCPGRGMGNTGGVLWIAGGGVAFLSGLVGSPGGGLSWRVSCGGSACGLAGRVGCWL